MIKKLIENKIIKYIFVTTIFIAGLFLLVFYINIFTQQVSSFYGSTLVKKVSGDTAFYSGNGVEISVTDIDNIHIITFKVPTFGEFAYEVEVGEQEEYQYPVSISENNQEIFSGFYSHNTSGPRLITSYGEVVEYDLNINRGNIEMPEDYSPSEISIISYALNEVAYIRGNIVYIFIAIMVLLILFIDIKAPLFFYGLYKPARSGLQPPDFFIFTQRVFRWIVAPLLIFGLLILALL